MNIFKKLDAIIFGIGDRSKLKELIKQREFLQEIKDVCFKGNNIIFKNKLSIIIKFLKIFLINANSQYLGIKIMDLYPLIKLIFTITFRW